MGNIYMEQGDYPRAIKMYRMALDQISDIHRDVRFKIMQSIGTVFVCMGRYADAITSFETIMEDQASFKTGWGGVEGGGIGRCFVIMGAQQLQS